MAKLGWLVYTPPEKPVEPPPPLTTRALHPDVHTSGDCEIPLGSKDRIRIYVMRTTKGNLAASCTKYLLEEELYRRKSAARR